MAEDLAAEALMGAVIEVRELRKLYGTTVAVDDVSFEVDENEIFGIVGPNGAGKTTTVECLEGLRRPDAGRIRVLGLDPGADARALRRLIGCQLQESALPDRMRVWEALDLFASLSPRGGDWRALTRQWGLRDKHKAPFGALSGGQRQRLFVALALLNAPKVVFLDEMTTGLDPAGRRVAWDLVADIRRRGTTVVLVTHFMDEAERLCDRIAVLKGGRVVAVDSPDGLVSRFAPGVRVRFTADHADVSWLSEVPHVHEVGRDGAQILVKGDGPVLALVAAALVNHGLVPEDLTAERADLEETVLRLTE
ncbi:MAG TPA: ABC transporter ATP-binding protein [Streptosporangiaceae bacterium]|nr:ABC transporter ATP-binding protein [Streptosporangiaceae bacterium]